MIIIIIIILSLYYYYLAYIHYVYCFYTNELIARVCFPLKKAEKTKYSTPPSSQHMMMEGVGLGSNFCEKYGECEIRIFFLQTSSM